MRRAKERGGKGEREEKREGSSKREIIMQADEETSKREESYSFL